MEGVLAGGLKDGKHGVHQGSEGLVVLLRDPGIHGLLQIGPLSGQHGGNKVHGADLPAEAVVLRKAGGAALDHLAGAVALQKQADDGGVRHDGDRSGLDGPVAGLAADLVAEAGAVVGPDLQDPAADRFRAEGGRVDRQVAALGVASQTKRAVQLRRDAEQVVHRVLLALRAAAVG